MCKRAFVWSCIDYFLLWEWIREWINRTLCLHNLKIYIYNKTKPNKYNKMLYALLLNTQYYFIFCSYADVLFVSKKREFMPIMHTNLKTVVSGSHMIKFHCFTNLFLMWQITICHTYLIKKKALYFIDLSILTREKGRDGQRGFFLVIVRRF